MKVAVQLYTVRKHMAKDPVRTIRDVAQIGFCNLETANHRAVEDPGTGFGMPVVQFRALLDELGINVLGGHIAPMHPGHLSPVLDYYREIGARFLICPMAFFQSRDDILRQAETLSRIGEECRTHGMELLYHNHYHEFQPFGDQTAFDLLMAHTTPDLLGIELDAYWVMRAGVDPLALMRRYGRRIRLVQLKDYPKGLEQRINLLQLMAPKAPIDEKIFASAIEPGDFTELGSGVVDIQSIIDTANAHCDCAYAVLEQDHTALDELESIRISLAYLNTCTGLAW